MAQDGLLRLRHNFARLVEMFADTLDVRVALAVNNVYAVATNDHVISNNHVVPGGITESPTGAFLLTCSQAAVHFESELYWR